MVDARELSGDVQVRSRSMNSACPLGRVWLGVGGGESVGGWVGEEGGGFGGVLVDLAEEAGPVADGGAHAAAVDVVESGGVGPVGFDVVDFEAHVRGYPGVW